MGTISSGSFLNSPFGTGAFQLFYQSDNQPGEYADAAARDVYFGANPDELDRLDNNEFLIIKLLDNGSGQVAYQQRASGAWVDVTSLVQGSTGPAGATGNSYFFNSIAERDAFFDTPPNEGLLENGLPVVVNVGSETASTFIWGGPTAPVSYDETLWRLASLEVNAGTLILGPGGAKIASGNSVLDFVNAESEKSYVAYIRYDDTGSYVPFYWEFAALSTEIIGTVFDTTLTDPQTLAFPSGFSAMIKAFTVIPATAGTLRVQGWVGVDETGPNIFDVYFEVLAGDIDNETTFTLPNDVLFEVATNFYFEFSGIQTKGGVQPSGPFVGQTILFLEYEAHVATIRQSICAADGEVLTTDTMIVGDGNASIKNVETIWAETDTNNTVLSIAPVTSSGSADLSLKNQAEDIQGTLKYDEPDDKIILDTASGVDIALLPAANAAVGIGTSDPDSLLHIYKDTSETTVPSLKIEQDGTGDALMQFVITGGKTWSVGADNGNEDRFKISFGNDLSNNESLLLDHETGLYLVHDNADTGISAFNGITMKNVSGGDDTYTSIQNVGDNSVLASVIKFNNDDFSADYGSIRFGSRDASGLDIGMVLQGQRVKIGADGSPQSRLHVYQNDTETGTVAGILVEQDGTGDAVTHYRLTGSTTWTVGADNSDSDRFKISNGAALDTETAIVIDRFNGLCVFVNQPSTDDWAVASGIEMINEDGDDDTYTTLVNRGANDLASGILFKNDDYSVNYGHTKFSARDFVVFEENAMTVKARSTEVAKSIGTPFGGFGDLQNILAYSEDLNQGTKLGANPPIVTSNNSIAPNGKLRADTVNWPGPGAGILRFGTTTTNGAPYTVSFWARYVSGVNTITVDVSGSAGQSVTVPDKWQKYHLSFIAAAGPAGHVEFVVSTAGEFDLWGIQLVDGQDEVFPYLHTEQTSFPAKSFGASISGQLRIAAADVGSNALLDIYKNDNLTSVPTMRLEQEGTGDVLTHYVLTGEQTISVGIENDSNDYAIAAGVDLSVPLFYLDSDQLYGATIIIDEPTTVLNGVSGGVQLQNLDSTDDTHTSIWNNGASNMASRILFRNDDYSLNYGSIVFQTRDSNGFYATNVVMESNRLGVGKSPASTFQVNENTSETGLAAGVIISQTGAGDSVLHFLRGITTYSVGIDATDSLFKISANATLGTNDAMTLEQDELIVPYGNISAYGKQNDETSFIAGSLAGDELEAAANNFVLIGNSAGRRLATGGSGVYIGSSAGNSIAMTIGTFNTAIGHTTLGNVVAENSRVTAVGSFAGAGAGAVSNSTMIGYSAGQNSTALRGVYLGYGAGNGETRNNILWISNENNDLIEGDFFNQWVKVHGNLSIGVNAPTDPDAQLHLYKNTSETTVPSIVIEQDGTGDALMHFILTGTKTWSVGVDNSNADRFKITHGTDLANDESLLLDPDTGMYLVHSNADTGSSAFNGITMKNVSGGDDTYTSIMNVGDSSTVASFIKFNNDDFSANHGSIAFGVNGSGGVITDAMTIENDGHVYVRHGNISAYGKQGTSSNFIAGSNAGNALTGGANLVFIGQSAGGYIEAGTSQVYIGFNAGYSASLTSGTFNCAVGHSALSSTTADQLNVTAIGSSAGAGGGSLTSSTMIGANAGRDATSTNSVFLGYDAGRDETENSKLWISSFPNDLVEGDFANLWLKIYGDLEVAETFGTPYGGFGTLQNRLIQSEQLVNASWLKIGTNSPTITPNNVTSPNGTLSADTVTFPGPAEGALRQVVTVTATNTYTLSFWAKNVSGNAVLNIDIGDGAISNVTVGSTWKRYHVILVAGASNWVDIVCASAGVFDMWGFQLSDGSDFLPYYKTLATAVTSSLTGGHVNEYFTADTVETPVVDTDLIYGDGDLKLESATGDIVAEISAAAKRFEIIGFTHNDDDEVLTIGTTDGAASFYVGELSPEGNVSATGGSFYFRDDETDTNLYAKQTSGGATTTGWKKGLTESDNLNATTGWLEGGQVTINVDPTKVDISAGSAYIVDMSTPENPSFEKVTWTAQTFDPSLSGRSTWIGVQSGPTFVSLTSPTPANLRNTAILARVWDTSGTGPTITNVGDYERPTWGLSTAFQDFILNLGSWNVSGNVFSSNGANLLLDKSAGSSYRYHSEDTVGSENKHTDSAATGITTYNYHLQGSGSTATESDIDPDNFDNAGSKTSVPGGYWQIQEIWMFPVSGTVHVLYGQAVYPSKVNALAAIDNEQKVRNAEILDGAVFRAYLVVQEGATTLDDAIFRRAQSLTEPTGGEGGNQSFVTKSYAISDYGANDDFYVAGFYEYSTASVTLTIGGTVTQTFDTANKASAAHAFVVASGAGGTDLVLTVSGTSITDNGVRTTSDSEIIVPDTDAAVTDQYFETSKKWLGERAYTLTGTSGSFTFNYGTCKYEDFGNRNFTVTDLEVVGLANANASDLNVELFHHSATGWTYAATGFVAGGDTIVDMATDYGTDRDLLANEYFAYKRANLSEDIDGSASEGAIIKITQTTNNAIRYATAHIGVLI